MELTPDSARGLPGNRRILTLKEEQNLLKMILRGYSFTEMGHSLDLPEAKAKQHALKLINEQEIVYKQNTKALRSVEVMQKVTEMALKGASYATVGRHLEISPTTAKVLIQEASKAGGFVYSRRYLSDDILQKAGDLFSRGFQPENLVWELHLKPGLLPVLLSEMESVSRFTGYFDSLAEKAGRTEKMQQMICARESPKQIGAFFKLPRNTTRKAIELNITENGGNIAEYFQQCQQKLSSKKITPAQQNLLSILLKRNAPIAQIARELGISKWKARNLCGAQISPGVQAPNQYEKRKSGGQRIQLSEEQRLKIREMMLQKMAVSAIAKEIGVSQGTAQRIVDEEAGGPEKYRKIRKGIQ